MAKEFDIFIRNIVSDLRVELADEFDLNFERKAFFDQPWQETQHPVSKGSLMNRSGALRGSIDSSVSDDGIRFTSSEAYAAIHNEGGTITVTARMKKYFWARYYKASGAVGKKKDGSASKSKRNTMLTQEAAYWKSLALMKVGSKITIPQRQFIGWHPRTDQMVEDVVNDNIKELNDSIVKRLKK